MQWSLSVWGFSTCVGFEGVAKVRGIFSGVAVRIAGWGMVVMEMQGHSTGSVSV